MTAQIYTWLTVITISGEIDATNAGQLGHHVTALVPDDGALIVDMVDTDFISVDGLRALFALNVECVRVDTRWAVIGSHAVHRLLRVADGEGLVPAVRSATEALQRVRRSRRERRPLQLVT
ncbi:MAG TPA: STAS domain-containing protein [Mycobacterium sp.]